VDSPVSAWANLLERWAFGLRDLFPWFPGWT
jgi:hypothetical protein